MVIKKKFILKLSAMILIINVCFGLTTFTADASEFKKEYGVTGKLESDEPIFNGSTSVDIKNGYYFYETNTNWNVFHCESLDGTLAIRYYPEKNNFYKFVITDQAETVVYTGDRAGALVKNGILTNNGDIKGTMTDSMRVMIDFSNLVFTKAKDRLPQGVYKGTGNNSLNVDDMIVKVYDTLISIDFYDSGKVIKHLSGNYSRVDAEGTTTFAYDYEGLFTASVTVDGKLTGSFTPEKDGEKVEFDLQLEEANTIKAGSYFAKGNFNEEIDEIRIRYTDMVFSMELVKAGTVIKLYDYMPLDEYNQDGSLVIKDYNGSTLLCELMVFPDGTATGKLYDGYNIDLNLSLNRNE